MVFRLGLAVLLAMAASACDRNAAFPGAGMTLNTRYGGGTLGGIESQREGSMQKLYGWQ
jgi:hypothetical protein